MSAIASPLHWQPEADAPDPDRIGELETIVDDLFGIAAAKQASIRFADEAAVRAMTPEDVMRIVRMARRRLLERLVALESHEHLHDDCGADLDGATIVWSRLHAVGEAHEWRPGPMRDDIAAVLLDRDDLRGTDGDIRYDLLPSALLWGPDADEDGD